jgi:hypothetical protein
MANLTPNDNPANGIQPNIIEPLCVLICDAFDAGSLEMLVQFKLGRSLFNLVAPAQSMRQTAFELVKVAEQEGWTKALIQAIYGARQNKQEVIDFCSKYAPFVLEAGDLNAQIRSARQGVSALSELVRQMANSAARATINGFRESFEQGRRKFDFLYRYKQLHDDLHDLQVTFLPVVAAEVERLSSNPGGTQALKRYVFQLRDRPPKVLESARGLPTEEIEMYWIENFRQAVDDLDHSVDDETPDSDRFALAHSAVNSLLALAIELPRINSLLVAQANELPLLRLIEAMRKIRGQAGTMEHSRSYERLNQGLEGLLLVEPRLAGLVKEHLEWQRIERGLSLAKPSRSAAETFPRWPDLKKRVDKLCDLRSTEERSSRIQRLAQRLDEAGQSADAIRIGGWLSDFCELSALQFHEVDKSLKAICEKLLEIAEALNLLLEVIADDDD